MITLTYTQHSLAFPTQRLSEDWHTDRVTVSLDHSGGGTEGEFSWTFMTFSSNDHGVEISVFGDSLSCFFDPRVQQVVQRWREAPDPDEVTVEQLCEWLREAGAVPSRYMPAAPVDAMSELDGVCHEKHEPINIDSEVRERLRAFLLRSDVPRGMGYSAFLGWALRIADSALEDCQDDGSGFCVAHYAPGTAAIDGVFECDAKGLIALTVR